MKQITESQLAALGAQAQQSPRRRANLNLHERLDDPIQRLAIAMEPDTYVRPHRHPHTWELLYPLAGRFVVLHFNEAGTLTDRAVLGADSRVIETPADGWHAVLSLDTGAVIFEVKHGPYQPIAEADYAPWSPAAETPGAATLMAWYATASVGERWRPSR
jgi:cupin fold WbuC family metalloprotein